MCVYRYCTSATTARVRLDYMQVHVCTVNVRTFGDKQNWRNILYLHSSANVLHALKLERIWNENQTFLVWNMCVVV